MIPCVVFDSKITIFYRDYANAPIGSIKKARPPLSLHPRPWCHPMGCDYPEPITGIYQLMDASLKILNGRLDEGLEIDPNEVPIYVSERHYLYADSNYDPDEDEEYRYGDCIDDESPDTDLYLNPIDVGYCLLKVERAIPTACFFCKFYTLPEHPDDIHCAVNPGVEAEDCRDFEPMNLNQIYRCDYGYQFVSCYLRNQLVLTYEVPRHSINAALFFSMIHIEDILDGLPTSIELPDCEPSNDYGDLEDYEF
jgi:hypothetical protein